MILVIYLNLDTFDKETMLRHNINELKTIYRVAALKETVGHPFRSPCVVIQTRKNDEIHMVKLLGALKFSTASLRKDS